MNLSKGAETQKQNNVFNITWVTSDVTSESRSVGAQDNVLKTYLNLRWKYFNTNSDGWFNLSETLFRLLSCRVA